MTRKPALSVLFSQAKAGDRIADAVSANGSSTRILSDVVSTSGHVYACISTATVRLMALATVSLSLMLAVEDASRAAPPPFGAMYGLNRVKGVFAPDNHFRNEVIPLGVLDTAASSAARNDVGWGRRSVRRGIH